MSFKTIKLTDIEDNPYRNPESYQYDQGKINALKDSITDTSFWENLLARVTKDGRVQLAYGHHRLQALKQLLGDGHIELESIKVNVRPENQLTNERMLKIFAQENKDDWGESPHNLCMTVLQLQAHLKGLINASKDKDQFLKKIGDSGALKVDDRSFTRMKNKGVGASIIAQFLGGTWSRQTIQDALQVLENDEATFKLAQLLPSVTLANRFQKLVTKGVEGEGKDKTVVMADEGTQRKVADTIVKEGLTRAEVEEAVKINKESDTVDPLAAIKEVVERKKDALKVVKEMEADDKPAPKTAVEKVQISLEKVLNVITKVHEDLTDEDISRIKSGIDLLIEVLDSPPFEAIEDVDESEIGGSVEIINELDLGDGGGLLP